MLKEALRVTQSDAKLGFSVWGRRENILLYPLLERVMEKHGLGPVTKPTKTNYDLTLKKEDLRLEMTEMGFKDIKMWFQPVNYVFNTFECFFETLFNQPSTAAKLQTLTPEQHDALMKDVKEEYEANIRDFGEPGHFENMIIIATKP